jgi:hypothetical protein
MSDVPFSALRATLPDRASGRVIMAAVAVCVAILATAPAATAAAPTPAEATSAPATVQSDRCGHTTHQRHVIRKKARHLGASHKQIRKVMRKCKRRAAIPTRVGHSRRRPNSAVRSASRGKHCYFVSYAKGKWTTVGGLFFEQKFGLDPDDRPRLASVVFRLHACANNPKKKHKRKLTVTWDVEGDVTTYGGPFLKWGTPTGGSIIENDRHPTARTWRTIPLSICPARIGCVGEGNPRFGVDVKWTRGGGVQATPYEWRSW